MRTYSVNLNPDPEMPRGLFDPRWQEPDVATRVSHTIYRRLDWKDATATLAQEPLPEQKRLFTDTRTFPLDLVVEDGARRFKGGSYGELHRRYSFGGRRPTVNFHAQAVCFGVDDLGRFYLRAKVGRFDGNWGNDAALTVKLLAGAALVGAIVWTGGLDPPQDKNVQVAGTDPGLKAQFAAVTTAVVGFTGNHKG